MIKSRLWLPVIVATAFVVSLSMACAPAPTQRGERKTRHEIFVKPDVECIPYRIPAIATASNGDLIAVADYRFSREDIGFGDNGRIDLRARVGRNNGKRWGEIFTLAEGRGAEAESVMEVGYGDPAIVADRESERVMVISCAGNVPYIRGTRENHLLMVRFDSRDNGRTWSEPVNIVESIYQQFDGGELGGARSMFLSSGRMMQSRSVKVGDYYRIYGALLVTMEGGEWMNFVICSDDFGQSWRVLGGVDASPITSDADEAKVEELPDGRVLISTRTQGGRYFNIFTYDNVAEATGAWDKMAYSSAENGGIDAKANDCNGEVMILPVRSTSSGERAHIILQSVPFGPERWNVGIYYKVLRGVEDYSSPEVLAANWDGRLQLSVLESAYSTMCWQQNDRLAVLFEEGTYTSWEGGGYTIIYDSYSIEELTDGEYEYDPS